PRPIVKIGIVELTAGQVLFIFLLAGAGGAYWVKRRRDLYRVRYGLVEYDFNKMMRLLERDIAALTAKLETPGSESDAENTAIEMRHTLATLQSTVEKMKGYLSREVRKLRR
ncbi:MAG: hypothetical protein HY436_01990, partial [Candidatus Liptonbacteria bacterium]|nr:hypothetical protein [Candidatus Liptonbacteria bacterium]